MTTTLQPKDKLDAVTQVAVNGPEDVSLDWQSIDWRKVEDQVRRLRQRIFTASREGDLAKVRSLQKLMLRSRANAMLSVRRVTEINAGRKTAGIDGKVARFASDKAMLVWLVQHRASSWKPLDPDDVVSWGGAGENYRPNYYITEDAAPARLGSSLGWLLQLDGDNLRNAFLNAPWVKAVIPIRPGKELAALNWLAQAHVEGTDGLDARYAAASDLELTNIVELLQTHLWPAGERRDRYTDFAAKIDADPDRMFVTIRDALTFLTLKVKENDHRSRERIAEQIDGVDASYLPTEKVFERGFDPLAGGFQAGGEQPFEVFSRWVEVLPTDQVVAVEVTYDPKTGRQI